MFDSGAFDNVWRQGGCNKRGEGPLASSGNRPGLLLYSPQVIRCPQMVTCLKCQCSDQKLQEVKSWPTKALEIWDAQAQHSQTGIWPQCEPSWDLANCHLTWPPTAKLQNLSLAEQPLGSVVSEPQLRGRLTSFMTPIWLHLQLTCCDVLRGFVLRL